MVKKFNEDWDSFSSLSDIEKESKSFDVIGLPSGQVIFMSVKQTNFFKGRELIGFVSVWKKPTAGGFIPIKLNKYCFEDVNYNQIMELMDAITW